MTTELFLITGGTGRVGHRVTRLLHGDGRRVRVASRSGASPFDWSEPSTWDASLDGASAAFICFTPDLGLPGADVTIKDFTDRAVRAGVSRLVLLSGRGEEGARRCEDVVRASGVETVVLRSAWFAQNFSENFLLGPVRRGAFTLPGGDVTEPFVDLDDLAQVAVLALTDPAHAGAVYEITGPEPLSFADVARDLSRATGRDIVYRPGDPGDLVADLVQDGIPAEATAPLAAVFAEILDGRNSVATETLTQLLGRSAGTFADYAHRAAGSGCWTPPNGTAP